MTQQNMPEKKPIGVTSEDWAQTPPAVRSLVSQMLNQRQQTGQTHNNTNSEKLLVRDVGDASTAVTQPVSESPPSGHLLVVDDNEMNRDMLSRRLMKHGHIVDVAVNGREALEMLKAKDFDVVLLDIMMPEMNGYEVLEWMKADRNLAFIPVIMITAVDEVESIVRCIELGAEDYLPKPFNPIVLKARVNASLEKKWLRDQQVAYMHQLDLENQRKSEELEQGRRIQLSMLPTKPPALSYLDIAARQETASEVGGDYYDFFPYANNHLRLAIGDATGHGVASGLMVSMTKVSLLSANEADLLTILCEINATLNKVNLGPQLNMALLLLEIFPKKNGGASVRVTGGGMPPVYIMRATGITDEIIISGLPLGIVDKTPYRQTEFDLDFGDVLLLASDGLPERFNAAREFLGFDRLAAALEAIDTTSATAAEILDYVATISDDWGQNYPPHDDMTLVVVKVK